MHTIAADVNRGGVGKTTTSFHLSMYLYAIGKRVLAYGMDTNQGMTKLFLKRRFNAHSVGRMNNYDLLVNLALPDAWREAIIHYDAKGEKLPAIQKGMPANLRHSGGRLDLITESRDLADAYTEFRPTSNAATLVGALPHIVRQIAASGEYDYCIIDNAPGWDPISKSVVYASQYVIAPIEAAPLSADALEEYVERVDAANEQRKQAGFSGVTQFLGVLLSRVKTDMDLQRDLVRQLPAALKQAGLTTFYRDAQQQQVLVIPESNAVLASSATNLPAWSNDPDDPGAQAFLALGQSIFHRLG